MRNSAGGRAPSAGTALDQASIMSAVVTGHLAHVEPKRDGSSTDALAELTDQHARLSDMMDRCEALADALDAGTAEVTHVLREVAQLRAAFDAHNQFEERLLRPALLEADRRSRAIAFARGEGAGAAPAVEAAAARVARIADAHVAEHRSMGQQLGSPTTLELRAVLASLRAHLETEQRSFEALLSP
jgi:ABC-type transporter Mla subunit MlaD